MESVATTKALNLYAVGIPPWTFTGAFISTSFLMFYARAFIPYKVITNEVNPKTQKNVVMEVNVNLCFAFYPAIKPRIAHIFDFYHPLVYIPYVLLLANFVINGPFYLVLLWFSDLYLAPSNQIS